LTFQTAINAGLFAQLKMKIFFSKTCVATLAVFAVQKERPAHYFQIMSLSILVYVFDLAKLKSAALRGRCIYGETGKLA
jgi:hypothetical protein